MPQPFPSTGQRCLSLQHLVHLATLPRGSHLTLRRSHIVFKFLQPLRQQCVPFVHRCGSLLHAGEDIQPRTRLPTGSDQREDKFQAASLVCSTCHHRPQPTAAKSAGNRPHGTGNQPKRSGRCLSLETLPVTSGHTTPADARSPHQRSPWPHPLQLPSTCRPATSPGIFAASCTSGEQTTHTSVRIDRQTAEFPAQQLHCLSCRAIPTAPD